MERTHQKGKIWQSMKNKGVALITQHNIIHDTDCMMAMTYFGESTVTFYLIVSAFSNCANCKHCQSR